MDWLLYVGRAFYTQKNFIEESRRLGISRRVAFSLLGGFSWGDRFWLAQGDLKRRNRKTPFTGSVVFASFRLTELLLLSPTTFSLAQGWEEIEDGRVGTRVRRGCGSYTIASIYHCPMTLQELSQYLRFSPERSRWKISIGGEIDLLDEPFVLAEYGFKFGLEKLDIDAIQSQLDDSEDRILRGTYPIDSTLSLKRSGKVLEIVDYREAEYYGRMSRDE